MASQGAPRILERMQQALREGPLTAVEKAARETRLREPVLRRR